MKAVEAAAVNADVLEYGCAMGELAIGLAPKAKSVCGIDISEVAIEQAQEEAAKQGLTNTKFLVADAMNTGLPDNSFDLVFGSGIIHHLDTEQSLSEINRILKPGGKAVFKEPMEGNFVLQMYRKATPDTRTPDEHPLKKVDFDIANKIFGKTKIKYYGLTTIAAVPFRDKKIGPAVYRVFATIDRLIFMLPGMKSQAWYVYMEMQKKA